MHPHRFNVTPISLSIDVPDRLPIDLGDEELKVHLALDGSAFDNILEKIYIPAAVAWAENYMHRTIMAREHRWVLRGFPLGYEEIRLPRGKTIAINDIEYTRGGQTLSIYGPSSGGSPSETIGFQEDLSSDMGGRIRPLRGRCWPSVDYDAIAPVAINFRAGYEEKSQVPPNIRHAILFALDDIMEVRGVTDLATLQSIAANGATAQAREALLSDMRDLRFY